MTPIDELLMQGKLREAMQIMRHQPKYKKELEKYVDLFEKKNYHKYKVSKVLNDILLAYQEYFREVFYCGIDEEQAAAQLIEKLCSVLSVSEADEDILTEKLQDTFAREGYHALFGKTQGYFGPYIWKDTVPTSYQVELPDGVEEYTVNFLKHEAQHVKDMREFPGITPAELEYRAKLVELCYSGDVELLQKFIAFADTDKGNDSHAMASVRIKESFSDRTYHDVAEIKQRALELFAISTEELKNDNF